MKESTQEDLNKPVQILEKIEAEGGTLVVGKHAEIWTVSAVSSHENEEMSISGFDTGTDLSKILVNVLEEMEMF